MKKHLPFSLALGALAVLVAFPAASLDGDAGGLMVAVGKVSPPPVLEALDAELYDYQVFELDLAAIDQRVRTHGALNLHLGNQTFDLRLEENNLRDASFQRAELSKDGIRYLEPGPITTFKGVVAGDPDSVVRLSVTPELFSGFISTGGEMIFVDPVVDFTRGHELERSLRPATGDVVVYREGDVRRIDAGSCASGVEHDLGSLLETLPSARATALSNLTDGLDVETAETHQYRTLEVALECDGQYYVAYGSGGATSRMEGIMNDVDGFIYDSELNMGINIVFSGCWTSVSGDPYTSLNASTTLSQMRSFWSFGDGASIATNRDVVHQFSGKDFSGSTIGIAYVGVICNASSYAVGISQDISGSASRRRLTAHEIGHNLDANHDTGVSCSGNGPIMCPSIQSGSSSAADDFSTASFNDIDDHIDTYGSCI